MVTSGNSWRSDAKVLVWSSRTTQLIARVPLFHEVRTFHL